MLVMVVFTVGEEAELASVAEAMLGAIPASTHASVIALSGELGAGKTALTKAIASVLRVSDHITSPTFVIMKSYPIPSHDTLATLTHVDAYRIESEEEMRVLGFGDVLADPRTLVVIEWPERIPSLIPAQALRAEIRIVGSTRTITYAD